MATPSIAPNPNTEPTNVNADLLSQLPSTTVKSEPKDSLSPTAIQPDADAAEKLAKSVSDLNSFAIAIQAFKAKYDELQNHLDFIDQAIEARSKELEALSSQGGGDTSNSVVPSEPKDETVEGTEPKAETLEGSEDEVLSLCQTMCSRGLRKYIITNLSDANLLREKVPVALQSAPKPAKIVFECIGRFFLQGSKAYTRGKDSAIVRARQASVLVLEYYLLSGCVGGENNGGMDKSLKEEANAAAVAWRKRLIAEGGVAKACESDARGLVLFIACFGIPGVFKNEDVWNLVKLSNAREISHALRQSQWLLKRVSEIADGMMKKGGVVVGSAVEAVDLAYTFGFEERFSPQTTLTSFLQKSEEAWKKIKQERRPAFSLLKQANEKYLAALKSVVNCLEGHKIDLITFLPGWEIKDKIINLEKDISEISKKMETMVVAAKRKVDKTSSSNNVKIPEPKRSRFPVASHSVAALQEHRIAKHMDGSSSYDGSLTAHLLDGRPYGYSNNYPSASSLQIGSVSGSLPESYLGGAIASADGGAIAGSAMSAGIGAPASYSGYQGDATIDPYRWRGIGNGVPSNDWSVRHSYAGQPSSAARVSNLYGRTSADGFAGIPEHPSVGVASRSGGGSDLYSFADSVFD